MIQGEFVNDFNYVKATNSFSLHSDSDISLRESTARRDR